MGLRSDLVEPLIGTPPNQACPHNFLKCKPSGIVLVDLSLGQFAGTMAPFVLGSIAEYLPLIPGDILQVEACPQSALDQQYERDSTSYRRQASPDSVPRAFAKRVVSYVVFSTVCNARIASSALEPHLQH
jgi:hypothetical protein